MSDDSKAVRRSVHDQVRDHLHDEIRSGRYVPGKSLPSERELSTRLNVSRNSLRQALASLEAIGVVQTRHGSGVYLRAAPSDDAVVRVADVLLNSDRSLENVVEARLAIEPFIAGVAAERHTAENLRLLEESIETSYESARSDGSPRRTGFHTCIAEMSGNPVFGGIVRSLLIGSRGAPRMAAADPGQRQVWLNDHEHIFEAVGDRDAKAAQRLMTTHLTGVLRTALLAQDLRTIEEDDSASIEN
ncbi:FadR/GntR family transcriptional regulator [Rhodococcus sp. H29-C3]|uniref:FadR/GntR family transcriptional regulator n=1 Tax=Rhodococcus sp. H29-C3 TaxID=3046307 RepID=UPI0024BB1603|nr:FadR/GntR family transcriptional regulator [Rhodococcus sp. H29-C3]MDJ0361879.1 FadR/GntR family transcriptional regulator [Rhodococcus sp. H29-C3]